MVIKRLEEISQHKSTHTNSIDPSIIVNISMVPSGIILRFTRVAIITVKPVIGIVSTLLIVSAGDLGSEGLTLGLSDVEGASSCSKTSVSFVAIFTFEGDILNDVLGKLVDWRKAFWGGVTYKSIRNRRVSAVGIHVVTKLTKIVPPNSIP
jgi:hypothetical protein